MAMAMVALGVMDNGRRSGCVQIQCIVYVYLAQKIRSWQGMANRYFLLLFLGVIGAMSVECSARAIYRSLVTTINMNISL